MARDKMPEEPLPLDPPSAAVVPPVPPKRPDQLIALSKPFPAALVKQAPAGKHGSYVSHSTINERLLHEIGPFTFEVTEVVRGHAPEVKGRDQTWPARDGAVVGVLARLTATIDGVPVSIVEVGSEDSPAMHHDGDNLKNAASDALKRCAMRVGVGLHLWSQQDYYLDRQLRKEWPDVSDE